MIEGELGGSLSSERVAVQLMGCDMQGCILAEGVVALLPFQHAYGTAAEVAADDAGLVEVGAHVLVHRVDQSRGCCVCCCACCDGMHVCWVCGWRSRQLRQCVEHIVGKPVATHKGGSTVRSACMYRVGRAELCEWALRGKHNAASCTGKGVLRVERRAVEGEVRAPAAVTTQLACCVVGERRRQARPWQHLLGVSDAGASCARFCAAALCASGERRAHTACAAAAQCE